VVQHVCLNGACAVRDLVFHAPWTDPWCPGLVKGTKQLCFGCSVRNISGRTGCAHLDSAETSYSPKETTWGKLAAQGSSLANLQDGLGLGADGAIGILALDGSPGDCETYIQGLGVLTSAEGSNLHHHVIQTVLQVFERVVQFGHLEGVMHSTRSKHVEQLMHLLPLPVGFDCTIIVSDNAMINSLGPFGSPILQRLCRHRPVALLSATGPVCFQRIVLGVAQRYLDTAADRIVSQPVRYSSMIMSLCLRNSFRAPYRVAWSAEARGMQISFVQRRGRQGIVNYESVRDKIASKLHHRDTKIIPAEFDGMTLVEIVHNMSASHVVTGVHGVDLTSILFMALPAAVVKVSLGVSEPDVFRLAQLLGVSHFNFFDVMLGGPSDRKATEKHLYIMDVDGLSRTVLRAANVVDGMLRQTPMLVW
jgi:hypothetical protein